jgi:hypothetical protein
MVTQGEKESNGSRTKRMGGVAKRVMAVELKKR